MRGTERASIAMLTDDDGLIVAAIPLASVDHKLARGLTAPYSTLFQPPLDNSEYAIVLGRLLAPHIAGVLRLDCIDVGDPAMDGFLRGLSEGGSVLAVYAHFANWHEDIAAFPDYWTTRGSRLKSTIKRKSAALTRDHRLRFETVDLTKDWQSGADIYNAIYAKSWKPPEPHEGFIGSLLRNLGPEGTARLALAVIDDVPAAAQIWLVRPPYATIFKLAQDPKFDQHSPGSLLTHWFLKELCENGGVRSVDFGRGDDAYKKDWLKHRRLRQGAIVANPRTLRGLVATILEIWPTKLSSYIHGWFAGSAANERGEA